MTGQQASAAQNYGSNCHLMRPIGARRHKGTCCFLLAALTVSAQQSIDEVVLDCLTIIRQQLIALGHGYDCVLCLLYVSTIPSAPESVSWDDAGVTQMTLHFKRAHSIAASRPPTTQ